MSKSTTILADAVRSIADRLEAAAAAPFKALEGRPFASLETSVEREASIALTAYGDAINNALDQLYQLVGFHGETVPPIAGGAPADNGDWTGPTPLSVLASDAPEPEGPTAEDWADYFAYRDWIDAHDHALTEEDHLIAHGCV